MWWTVLVGAAGCVDAQPPCETLDMAPDDVVDGVTPGEVSQRLDALNDLDGELRTVANELLPGTVSFEPGAATREQGAACAAGFLVEANVRLHARDGTIDVGGPTALEVTASDPWVAVLSLDVDDVGSNDLGLVSLTGTIDPATASGELHLAQHGALIVSWVLSDPSR